MIGQTGIETVLAMTTAQPAVRVDRTQENTDSLSELTSGQTSTGSIDPTRANTYVLRDTIANGGFVLSALTLIDEQLDNFTSYLDQIQQAATQLKALEEGSEACIAQRSVLADLEKDLSSFIGTQVHAKDLELTSVMDSNAKEEFISWLTLEEAGNEQATSQQIQAVEVDFVELFNHSHNPQSCEHCLANAQIAASSQTDTPILSEVPSTTTNEVTGATTSISTSSSINSILMSSRWDLSGDDTLTYSYYDGSVAYDSNYNAAGLNLGNPQPVDTYGSGNSALLDNAFEAWDAVGEFEFSKVTESGTDIGELRVAYTDRSSSAAAFAINPGSSPINGDIYFEIEDTDIAGSDDFDIAGQGTGGFNYFAALHEIGHALGLSHPFDGSSGTGTTLPIDEDNFRATVMSYVQSDRNMLFQWNNDGSANFSKIYAATPMPLDIRAIEHLYGKETTGGSDGDQTYSFTPDATTGMYHQIRTLYDSGGTDTLDASAFSRGSVINLTGGKYSSLGVYSQADQVSDLAASFGLAASYFEGVIAVYDAQASASNAYYSSYDRSAVFTGADNIAIAKSSVIENAVGGSGDDTITGNASANTLTGGSGDDTIQGGWGVDTATFSGQRSAYTITETSTGNYTVSHNSGGADGTDTLASVELARFADGSGGYEYYDLAAGTSSSSIPTSVSEFAAPYFSAVTRQDFKEIIESTDLMLANVNSQRARLGATLNRLDHIVSNLVNNSNNIKIAVGTQQDADYAVEMTRLAKTMILQKAASQVLRGSAEAPRAVLGLLG